ncbi:hypothetical protein J7J13_03020 [bacterium]|nr:hypothetical protein [bacterium]
MAYIGPGRPNSLSCDRAPSDGVANQYKRGENNTVGNGCPIILAKTIENFETVEEVFTRINALMKS